MSEATVTLPIAQFNLLKRALRAAWTFREHQLEGTGKLPFVSPSRIKFIQLEYDLFRQLESDLDENLV